MFPSLIRHGFFIRALMFCLPVTFVAPVVYSQDREVLFREDFNSLDNWKPVYFPKIERHTSYTVESERQKIFLRAESRASASGIVFKHPFNVYEYPRVTWRWKVENTYEKGNARSKSGDDYPMRVYVMFMYDPEKVGFLDRVKYEMAKLIYGEYPPHSSLNYIWANRKHKEQVITSTYTKKSKMIPLQMGGRNLGTWQIEDQAIIEDYKRAFGTDPPPMASIAIMNDSDNTGEESVSYIDYIEVYRRKNG
jgi:hypothetical protein